MLLLLQNINDEERMGHLRIKANEGSYKDKGLREHFRNSINDDMMTEIMRELTTITRTI